MEVMLYSLLSENYITVMCFPLRFEESTTPLRTAANPAPANPQEDQNNAEVAVVQSHDTTDGSHHKKKSNQRSHNSLPFKISYFLVIFQVEIKKFSYQCNVHILAFLC